MIMNNVLWYIIIGISAGYIAGRLMKIKGFGHFANLLVGLAGAMLGVWLFSVFNFSFGNSFLGSLITAVLGAVFLLYLIRLIKKV